MGNESRKDIRYGLKNVAIKGEIILYPDPYAISVSFDDISTKGAGLTLVSDLDEKAEEELMLLVNAWKKGMRVPIQFSLNNTKIPAHIVSKIGQNKLGLLISDNLKLASLAERGKRLFENIISGVITSAVGGAGSAQAGFFSKSSLPPEIADFIQAGVSSGLVERLILGELKARLPALNNKEPEEARKIDRLFAKYFQDNGGEASVLVGQMLFFMAKQNPTVPLEEVLPIAVNKLFSEGAVFGDVLKRFETFMVGNYIKKLLPPLYRDLPPRHPLAELVRAKFEAFNGRTFFLTKIAPSVCNYYIKVFSPKDSDAATLTETMDEKQIRRIVLPWVQGELNALASSKVADAARKINDALKQAMYEYAQRAKLNNLTFEEVSDISDNRLSKELSDISDRFMAAVCRNIDPGMRVRFAQYKAETEDERREAQNQKENDARIQAMSPADLMKRYCWNVIVESGEINQLQREAARSWVPKENLVDYLDLGGIIIIPRPAYEEFLRNSAGADLIGERIEDFFKEVDLLREYRNTITMPNGKVKKDALGVHLDTLQPKWVRDLILEKVIFAPEWNKYYILGRYKSYFLKVFRKNSQQMIKIIEENMLSADYAKSDYI
ncbi:MAG: hypothetical protein HY280_00275 [Nitrospinae bacterium]|nr:hypothetical protein [Nitrospinota bacterium]